ncbi:ABC transporter permease [Psychromicrobium xiongbiense]|uniref:ABC transporter permease n=1 Tax=Psychromicrobium xiongbiense TaxID=3051184 RepID=UPI0025533413|nr:ABC transporter permease [Psychromicrobium sp. YIM S02556]
MSTLQLIRLRRPASHRALTLWIGVVLLGIVVVMAVASFVALPYDPADTTGGRLKAPSAAHWAGTDTLGRDIFTQLLIGARLALAVGVGSVLIAAIWGITLGLLIAYASRWLDDALTSLLDVAIAFPTLLLAMLIVIWHGASLESAILAIGLAGSAVIARLTRVVAKRVLGAYYVTAARTSGARGLQLVWWHVLPNVWTTLIVPLALQFGGAVIAEASLSYLGLGSPPPNASWGKLLQEAQATVLLQPTSAILPGVMIVITAIGINLLADGIRDVVDPTVREGSR